MVDPLVQSHLRGVARRLRERPVALDPARAARRDAALARLAAYADAGMYPKNDVGVRHPARPVRDGFSHTYDRRAPIFVDAQGTHCAVAHVIAGDDPRLVADIRARFNDRWLPDMDAPELAVWAEEHGLTAEELAQIQPSYEVWIENCEGEPQGFTTDDPGVDGDAIVFTGQESPCFDTCDGDLLIWYPVANLGTVDIVDATLDIAWVESNGAPADEVAPLTVADLTVPATSLVYVGPFHVPQSHVGDLIGRRDITLTLTVAGDPDASNNTADGWEPPMVSEPITAVECEGKQWGSDNNEMSDGCGCAGLARSAGAPLPAALIALAAAGRRRARRAAV